MWLEHLIRCCREHPPVVCAANRKWDETKEVSVGELSNNFAPRGGAQARPWGLTFCCVIPLVSVANVLGVRLGPG
jgi:hypothetical protein